jgi:hypothetical protein
VRKSIPILSIVTWLGGISTITRGPFSDLGWFSPPEIVPCLALGAFAGLMGRYDPTLLIYQVCGIALAVIADIGGFRWAHLASLVLSVLAALWGLLDFLAGRFIEMILVQTRPSSSGSSVISLFCS